MTTLNYKFVASGIGNVVKANVYPLARPSALKAPVVYPSGYMGKFVTIPIVLRSQKTGKELSIPEALVTLTRKKKIVSTQVVGGNGTVKEFISDDDMDVTIVLGIVATDEDGNIIDEYPEAGIRDLREILDERNSIDITSDFLKLFDIDGGSDCRIVVTDYSMTQETHSNRQVVNITALSDYDYTIYSEES
jgi:hypothetical protein